MTAKELLRGDLRLIAELVPPESRVLDLGCGDGSLLEYLRDQGGCTVRGVELDPELLALSIDRGIPVVQADLDAGLAGFADGSFDYVVLSQTLQVVHRPGLVVREMLRVGHRCIVSFPNFGHWRVRAYLALKGRMPVAEAIPYSWHDTPNIHHTTVKDFRDFCSAQGARVERELALRTEGEGKIHQVRVLPNLLADTAVTVVTSA